MVIDMKIEINMLPVGNGDCIHIRFCDSQGWHNVIIDSGPSKARRMFRNLLNNICESGEQVDLLCFTHIDDDHIKAAAQVFSDMSIDYNYIKAVWLNTGNMSAVDEDLQHLTDAPMTVNNAIDLYKYLKIRGIPVLQNVLAGMKIEIGDAMLTVISPNEVKHNKYLEYWQEKAADMDMSARYDVAETNGDSIAFWFQLDGKCLLFLGDAHADALIEGLDKYPSDIPYCLAKLPHHGSIRNLNVELLEKMAVDCFLISSKKGGQRPSGETIGLIDGYKAEKKKLLCNFELEERADAMENIEVIDLTKSGYILDDDIYIRSEEM